MARRFVKLTFPPDLIKEPVIYRVSKQYDVVPNIRRARVTRDAGEVVLELEGEETNLEQGIVYLTDLGVKVEPVTGNLVE